MITEEFATKQCIDCGESKLLTPNFNRHSKTKDGWGWRCKSCIALLRQGDGTKHCTRCKTEKPLTEFFFNTRDGTFQSWCKSCHAADKQARLQKNRSAISNANHNYYVTHRDEIRAKQRISWLARYGLTPERYEEMLADQSGGCAICGSTSPRGSANFHVDHDHACCPSTKECCGQCVRGLLCRRCNQMLGQAEDDVALLKDSVTYLEKWRDDSTTTRDEGLKLTA